MRSVKRSSFDGQIASGQFIDFDMTKVGLGELQQAAVYLAISGTAASKAQIAAQVLSVEVHLGEDKIRDYLIAEHQALQDYYNANRGLVVDGDGTILIDFETPWRHRDEVTSDGIVGPVSNGLGLLDEDAFVARKMREKIPCLIRVYFTGTVTINQAEVYVQGEPDLLPPGSFLTVRRKAMAGSVSGEQLITLPEYRAARVKGDQADRVLAVHAKHADGTLLEWVVKAANLEEHRIRRAVAHRWAAMAGRTAQSGYSHLELGLERQTRSRLWVPEGLEYFANWSTPPSASWTVIAEAVETRRTRASA